VGGQSRKMAKPIFEAWIGGVCEHSEHGKSQLSIKYLCPILIALFTFVLQKSLSLSAALRFFRFPIALRFPK